MKVNQFSLSRNRLFPEEGDVVMCIKLITCRFNGFKSRFKSLFNWKFSFSMGLTFDEDESVFVGPVECKVSILEIVFKLEISTIKNE